MSDNKAFLIFFGLVGLAFIFVLLFAGYNPRYDKFMEECQKSREYVQCEMIWGKVK